MASLDRIEIEGYKSIRKLDLELRPLNILIGANGAGKSNFMSAIKLLNRIADRNLQLFVSQVGGADDLLYFGQKATSEIRLQSFFNNLRYEVVLKPTDDDTFTFALEKIYWRNLTSEYALDFNNGYQESRLVTDSQKVAREVLDTLVSWTVYHFQDTTNSAGIKKTQNIDDNLGLRSDGSNLAAYLYLLKSRHPKHYLAIVETIRLVAPFFKDFLLRPTPHNEYKIRLEWQNQGSDAYFNANMLSDGTLRFICLATLLLQPNPPSTIIIDEPELGLHPYAITLLANLLSSAATKTQVIVSTQSVSLIDHFEPEDIIVVERENQESVFKRLSTSELEQWLESYSLGELWEKNVIGGRP